MDEKKKLFPFVLFLTCKQACNQKTWPFFFRSIPPCDCVLFFKAGFSSGDKGLRKCCCKFADPWEPRDCDAALERLALRFVASKNDSRDLSFPFTVVVAELLDAGRFPVEVYKSGVVIYRFVAPDDEAGSRKTAPITAVARAAEGRELISWRLDRQTTISGDFLRKESVGAVVIRFGAVRSAVHTVNNGHIDQGLLAVAGGGICRRFYG